MQLEANGNHHHDAGQLAQAKKVRENQITDNSSDNNKMFKVQHQKDHAFIRPGANIKAPKKTMRRALSKLNRRGRRLRHRISESLKSWDEIEWAERQNSVSTLDLFKYADRRERVAVFVGILFMWYAASWQPISVFILATMASIMGQYAKKVAWIWQLTSGGGSVQDEIDPGSNWPITSSLGPKSLNLSSSISSHDASSSSSSLLVSSQTTHREQHDTLSLLAPMYSFITPLFDLGSGGRPGEDGHSGGRNASENNIEAAIHDIEEYEAKLFLRQSFAINGSAFVLALSQLAAFFIGMTLITWAARKQASRVKILYFRSCLHQEVTWFEAIDSASGSGSSLNALVDKYEDGIGMKLALLCYFIGHVALFALIAFYQMFSLAAFCMPFVLLVGLVIAYLSDWQAVAIGQHALFAKRALQLAEEILAAIRTVFAFNGQQKEMARYSVSLEPVYRKSLVKHLYTALNTSLSKFSIFACFACYCFYAMRLFPPYTTEAPGEEGASAGAGASNTGRQSHEHIDKSVVLAVMRGAEVSIVNILISIPFMEALQQSKGSIARIYAAIQRRSKINPAAEEPGARLASDWKPTISFRMVQFGYAQRSGPTQRRRSTLPFLNLAGSPGSGVQVVGGGGGGAGTEAGTELPPAMPNLGRRRQSLIDEMADELDIRRAAAATPTTQPGGPPTSGAGGRLEARRPSAAIKRVLGGECQEAAGGRGLSNKRILNYFNLEIKAGQSVALVGPSGSGKSTVLALVQRLYDITGGQLLIGQRSVKDLNVSWLRNQIGVVTQEPRLFDMTIADNIRLGLSEYCDGEKGEQMVKEELLSESSSSAIPTSACMQQVIDASRAAGAHDFIMRLPQGYATRVGSGGVQLSGGQKQRLAIARALIRKPKILLLDESTSALDTESEAQVQQALQAASAGRTTLTVAHRLSTIKHVDLIVVMYQGQVVECGSHEELMSAASSTHDSSGALGHRPAGIYRRMYEDQLAAVESRRPAAEIEAPASLKSLKERPGEGKGVESPLSRLCKFDEVRADSCEGRANYDDEEENGGEKSDENDDDYEDYDYEDDYSSDIDDDDTTSSTYSSSTSSAFGSRPSAWQLWQFVEMPKWSSLAAALVCLLAGLILPMNLIAHSYLFKAFAFNELEQLGNYLHLFGLLILSFSTFVFIVSFLQIILPGYVGEKLSTRLRVKTMESLLSKPMFYFDMDSNSAGALCDRFNSYISNIQSIAGTRIATMLEAVSTLTAGAFFGFGQNLSLSLVCLSFALLVLVTTILESRIFQRESNLQQRYDAQLAHLMADALSNIKTIASLNKERFFIDRFSEIIRQRELGSGWCLACLRTFLTSIKFIMPAMSWSASMYYACHLLVEGRIDVQTIFIVCPVVLFAVNDTFRALVFLPELLKARKSIERLYRMNQEFSPQALQGLTLAQQLEQQSQLHLEQVAQATTTMASMAAFHTKAHTQPQQPTHSTPIGSRSASLAASVVPAEFRSPGHAHPSQREAGEEGPAQVRAPKRSISFAEPDQTISMDMEGQDGKEQQPGNLVNRRLSNIGALPTYMRRKSSRLNSLIPSRSQARGRIEFRDVEFAYPNRPSALVLDGFSLSVSPGESVALVGGSGSGKSTCVAILEKFYDFHAGRVTLDGLDLRLVDCNWTRSQIGLVSQEPTLLSYTIGDNIRYGDNSRFVSMDEVVEAARTANIHDFIMSLPDQYDTELSSSAFSSSQLSGGQRQRIAIARALIRNAPILIFDEATSALDSRNESVVQDALNKARRGRTSLTIAHRLATVKEADKIAVLSEGRVVEVGKHDELIRRPNGHYRRLWERQEGVAPVLEEAEEEEEGEPVDFSSELRRSSSPGSSGANSNSGATC